MQKQGLANRIIFFEESKRELKVNKKTGQNSKKIKKYLRKINLQF